MTSWRGCDQSGLGDEAVEQAGLALYSFQAGAGQRGKFVDTARCRQGRAAVNHTRANAMVPPGWRVEQQLLQEDDLTAAYCSIRKENAAGG